MDVATLPSSGQPAEQHAWAPSGGRGDVSTLCPLLCLKVGFVHPWFLLHAAKAATVHTDPTAGDLLPSVVLKL